MLAIKSLVVFALPLIVTANPLAARNDGPSCNTGSLQCCNKVQQASNPTTKALLGGLNVVISDITALVGIDCTPISVIGVGSNSCTQQPVCCTNNNFNGLINIGCTPISL